MKINNSELKLNNKGFSLIELIVTIAIIAIMAGAAAVTVSMLDSSYVEDAERGLKDSIGMARTKSMSVSAKDWYVSIGKEGSSYYACLYKVEESDSGVETILIEKEELGAKIKMTYTKDKDYAVSFKTISGNNKLELHMDPATGKVNKVVYGDGSGEPEDISEGIGYIGISRNDYKIILKVFYNTGKCERE